MNDLSCRVARSRLAAQHDDELTLDQQITLEAHVSRCATCAAARDDLGVIRTALRYRAAQQSSEHETSEGLALAIVEQLRAEQ